VSAASTSLSTIASSVTAALGESNVQAASATVSSLGAKTRGAVSSTVSFLEEKGVVSGAQGFVASAGVTAKSVFAFAQSGVCCTLFIPHNIFLSDFLQWQGLWRSGANDSQAQDSSDSTISDAGRVEVLFVPARLFVHAAHSIMVQTHQSPRVIPSSLQQVSSTRSYTGAISRPPV